MSAHGFSFDWMYVGSALLLIVSLATAVGVTAWHLNRINPQLAGAVIGALVGLVLLECLPLLT
jgi:hypothetical protein